MLQVRNPFFNVIEAPIKCIEAEFNELFQVVKISGPVLFETRTALLFCTRGTMATRAVALQDVIAVSTSGFIVIGSFERGGPCVADISSNHLTRAAFSPTAS